MGTPGKLRKGTPRAGSKRTAVFQQVENRLGRSITNVRYRVAFAEAMEEGEAYAYEGAMF